MLRQTHLKGESAMETVLIEQMGFMLGDWIPKEASIAVAVAGRYVYFKAGAHDLKVQIGEAVPKGSIAEQTLKEVKRVEKLVEASSLGSTYYGIGYPVEIQGQTAALVVILPATYIIQKRQTVRFLTGKLEEVWRPVPIGQVIYIESSQKKTWFYANEETYCSIHTLKNLKEQLPDVFLPIHRSYIVNINYIEEISRDVASNYILTMKDGAVLPVSQNYATSVRERLGF
ncbi:LytTR family DNA-binding domain-containing protein [Planococcus shixiaomingii]|nr:LytTR family DNA-binding domain-containing protein [Planococcus sp. N028]